ncbi:unnamed protein product [Prunus armeniaca]
MATRIAARLYSGFSKIFWRIGTRTHHYERLGHRASPFQVLSSVRDIGLGPAREDTDTRELGGA